MEKRPAIANLELTSAQIAPVNIKTVGDLKVLVPRGFNRFSARRVFYVKPVNPPAIAELTDKKVDALNAAAYYDRQPTPALAAIPVQFAQDYTDILKSLTRVLNLPARLTPFTFVSNLRSSRVEFGRLFIPEAVIGEAKVTTSCKIELVDNALHGQARFMSKASSIKETKPIEGTVEIRLFPPGLGSLVYAYEKGYYIDGDVEEWKDLVWQGRYITPNALTPDQLQALARGEKPYPQVKYLAESIFKTLTPKKALEELTGREDKRIAERMTSTEYRKPYQGGDFDEANYDPNRQRDADPEVPHVHKGLLTFWPL